MHPTTTRHHIQNNASQLTATLAVLTVWASGAALVLMTVTKQAGAAGALAEACTAEDDWEEQNMGRVGARDGCGAAWRLDSQEKGSPQRLLHTEAVPDSATPENQPASAPVQWQRTGQSWRQHRRRRRQLQAGGGQQC